MNLWPLILLLGTCSSHRTTTTSVRNMTYDLSNGTLKNVIPADARSINLSYLNIKSIAANSLDTLNKIETLDLSNNDLVDLPPFIFSKLVNLKELSLFNNRISSFNNTFFGLINLERLIIAKNPIKSLKRGDLFGLTKSVKVIVNSTKLKTISSRIFKKPSVPAPNKNKRPASSRDEDRHYNYSHDSFEIHITDGILESLEHIEPNNSELQPAYYSQRKKSINLTGNKISGFKDEWFKVNDSLYNEINLSSNDIKELAPELLNNLSPAITGIVLSHNHIAALKRNDHIKNTTIDLILNDNRISTIQDGAFGKLNLLALHLRRNLLDSAAFVRTLPATIRILNLEENQISEVPFESFYGLENLEYLSIASNQVKNIEPGTFRDQKNLRILKLMNNKISELKPGFFLGLDRLKIINLSSNQIKIIPSNLFEKFNRHPTKLKIELNSNRIKTIEDGAFSHMNLTLLSLEFNEFEDNSIREGAFNGSDIYRIKLTSNTLTRFDGEWFKDVSGLERIFLGSNSVKKIEKGLAKYMKNVKHLHLRVKKLSLENGVLFGLSTEKEVKISVWWKTRIGVIEGGLFEDL